MLAIFGRLAGVVVRACERKGGGAREIHRGFLGEISGYMLLLRVDIMPGHLAQMVLCHLATGDLGTRCRVLG